MNLKQLQIPGPNHVITTGVVLHDKALPIPANVNHQCVASSTFQNEFPNAFIIFATARVLLVIEGEVGAFREVGVQGVRRGQAAVTKLRPGVVRKANAGGLICTNGSAADQRLETGGGNNRAIHLPAREPHQRKNCLTFLRKGARVSGHSGP